jgi:hypothetical protein
VADEEQVKILKEQGSQAWNEWRRQNPRVKPNLSGARLVQAKLEEMDFRSADLSCADLTGANLFRTNFAAAHMESSILKDANLAGARFVEANLNGAKLDKATLNYADLPRVTLKGASIRDAFLPWVNLTEANLADADLQGSHLLGTNFYGADLTDTEFSRCEMWETILGNVDLSRTKGLGAVEHSGPSMIGIDTIFRSGGKIPEAFLRGAGVPEPFIANMTSLVAAMSPIEFYSCFISYSSKDHEFAERLHADLRSKNVRCWFAPEDLKIGDRLRPSFDEAIRVHDKLMVLLSESSVRSEWVEKEVETAFEKERREKRTVLFPIRLDDAVMQTNEAWAADIRRTRHIGDFRDWKNHDAYKKAFDRLLRDLKA